MPKKTEATPKKRLTKTEKDKATLRKLATYIKKTNADFEAATPDQKRVQIAQDVIFQLDIGRMKASSCYFDAPKDFYKEFNKCTPTYSWDSNTYQETVKPPKQPDVELQTLFAKMPSCTVCGIGSVFVSAVDRMDRLKATDAPDLDREEMVDYLASQKIFNERQADLIEAAFEGYTVDGKNGGTWHYGKTEGHDVGHDGSEERLRTIMQLIINAKGVISRKTFKPIEYIPWVAPSVPVPSGEFEF